MNKELYIKRLRYQSHHRGIKEADLLFGGFADRHLSNFNVKQLQDYEDILQIPDADILDWVYGRAPIPSQKMTDMIKFFLNDVAVIH